MTRLAPLLILLAACDDPRFTELYVVADEAEDEIYVAVSPPGDKRPCPELRWQGDVTVNGEDGLWYSPGGEDGDPDGVFYGCAVAEIYFPSLVPIADGAIEVVIDDPSLQAIGRVEFPDRVWTDDDVAAAYTAGEPVRVNWTPTDVGEPVFSVESPGSLFVSRLVDGPGTALLTFSGTSDDPAAITLVGGVGLADGAVTCTGIDLCVFNGTLPFVVETP